MRTPKGWELISTGGNCDAFCFDVFNADDVKVGYALITSAVDPSVPTTPTEPVTLGFYLQDRSDPAAQFHLQDTRTAVLLSTRLLTLDGVLLKGWQ
jgi:hypothetical protein